MPLSHIYIYLGIAININVPCLKCTLDPLSLSLPIWPCPFSFVFEIQSCYLTLVDLVSWFAVCCCYKTLTKSNLESKGFISP